MIDNTKHLNKDSDRDTHLSKKNLYSAYLIFILLFVASITRAGSALLLSRSTPYYQYAIKSLETSSTN